ncbi:hypothetical protein SLA2020_053520 [Shorea laevis]
MMPSRASRPGNSSGNQTENHQNEGPDAPPLEQDSSIPPPPPLESPGDDTASNLLRKARWYTALEIGGSLRYLHDECPDGPIAHLSVCSSHVVFLHGCSAMLRNFLKAKQLNVNDEAPCHGNSIVGCAAADEDESLSVDVHDYGMLLVELITGNGARLLAVFHMKERSNPYRVGTATSEKWFTE